MYRSLVSATFHSFSDSRRVTWALPKMLVVSVICCAFLVLNANASPVQNYFERPLASAKEAGRSSSDLILHDAKKKNDESKTKLFYIAPREMIESNLVETSNEDLENQFSSVLCEAGKSSGWLHCTDPSGEVERFEAEKICQAHGQTLWTYAPKTSYQPDYVFWICSVSRKHR
ncbi:uncharacterized protein LOC130696367 [Daphnia carinata]|uniref:uncharacterized protein LOC130696367 n=1 Tax=Daphnia carinata TaxID=120202 RepID=UPI00257CB165|nr:uncharacterized protein LOC130696367 [Daphnia carinata]